MKLAAKIRHNLRWLPVSTWQHFSRRPSRTTPVHLFIALADHFEPEILPESPGTFANRDEQERRLERWCKEYPKLADPWRDVDGRPFKHTYFCPAEQYDRDLVSRLAHHCHEGWGEVEIHLHHGVQTADTSVNTRHVLNEFRDKLAGHGCLSRLNGIGPPRYAFVHGNWALANSAGGTYCGVDDEMKVLAETGCYADFTLPSAPNRSQVRKINALYECSLPLDCRTPHRRGRDLRIGRPPTTFPLIVQGPLQLKFIHKNGLWPVPRIENSAITTAHPPTIRRLHFWRQCDIVVKGRPEWVFIKLHCHGMDPRDDAAMLGARMREFLREISVYAKDYRYQVHFVTAREMVNVILAACDGREGNPSDFRDYRFQLLKDCKSISPESHEYVAKM